MSNQEASKIELPSWASTESEYIDALESLIDSVNESWLACEGIGVARYSSEETEEKINFVLEKRRKK